MYHFTNNNNRGEIIMAIPSGKFECYYADNCMTRRVNPSKCISCDNNTKRNYEEDHYKKTQDNPIPEKCPRLTYSGPAEQTAGYRCPVCNGFTNPYEMRNSLCRHCGYKLNTGG